MVITPPLAYGVTPDVHAPRMHRVALLILYLHAPRRDVRRRPASGHADPGSLGRPQ